MFDVHEVFGIFLLRAEFKHNLVLISHCAREDPMTVACGAIAGGGLAPRRAVAARLLLGWQSPRAATTRRNWNRSRCWAWPVRTSPMTLTRLAIGSVGLAPSCTVAALIDLFRTSPRAATTCWQIGIWSRRWCWGWPRSWRWGWPRRGRRGWGTNWRWRRRGRQTDALRASRGLIWIAPTSPSTSAKTPTVATSTPVRSMTVGCALTARDHFGWIFRARFATISLASVVVRRDQIQPVAKSITFGTSPLQT